MIDFKRLKVARKSLNMNQKELAKLVGVTQATMCEWEKGIREPREKYVKTLCEILKTDIRISGYEKPPKLVIVPERLIRAREKRNLMTYEVEDFLGISERSMINWENGTAKPNSINTDKLIDFFGVGILEGEEDFWDDCEQYYEEDIPDHVVNDLEESYAELNNLRKVWFGYI